MREWNEWCALHGAGQCLRHGEVHLLRAGLVGRDLRSARHGHGSHRAHARERHDLRGRRQHYHLEHLACSSNDLGVTNIDPPRARPRSCPWSATSFDAHCATRVASTVTSAETARALHRRASASACSGNVMLRSPSRHDRHELPVLPRRRPQGQRGELPQRHAARTVTIKVDPPMLTPDVPSSMTVDPISTTCEFNRLADPHRQCDRDADSDHGRDERLGRRLTTTTSSLTARSTPPRASTNAVVRSRSIADQLHGHVRNHLQGRGPERHVEHHVGHDHGQRSAARKDYRLPQGSQ